MRVVHARALDAEQLLRALALHLLPIAWCDHRPETAAAEIAVDPLEPLGKPADLPVAVEQERADLQVFERRDDVGSESLQLFVEPHDRLSLRPGPPARQGLRERPFGR